MLMMTSCTFAQTAVALLHEAYTSAGSAGRRQSISREQIEGIQEEEYHEAAALASQASSRDSTSEGTLSPAVDMRAYHPPRIAPKDVDASQISPAERYSEWISANVHGQLDPSMAMLANTLGEKPLQSLAPKHAPAMAVGCAGKAGPPGSGIICAGPPGHLGKCNVVVGAATVSSSRAQQAREQTYCTPPGKAPADQGWSHEDAPKLKSHTGDSALILPDMSLQACATE